MNERTMPFEIKPLVLANDHVVLEPLAMTHVPDLQAAVTDGELWRLWYANVPAPEGMAAYVTHALNDPATCAFAVRDAVRQRVVGTTRLYHIEPQHRRALIGYTWYAQSAQASAVNPAAKLLLMTQLFEAQQAVAVEFRTHFFNHRSRAAIERLGAKLDGVLRSHQIMPDGSLRDTVVYSILAHEWPAVRQGLRARLGVQAK
jgi:RimJ/RimL family protein N-acetyltransferase